MASGNASSNSRMLRMSAPEGIDGLVGITHDGDLTVLFGELEHKIVLNGLVS